MPVESSFVSASQNPQVLCERETEREGDSKRGREREKEGKREGVGGAKES